MKIKLTKWIQKEIKRWNNSIKNYKIYKQKMKKSNKI